MYHPLLVFDGETDQLITAVLRPGNAHGARGAVAVLKRLVGALRTRWPGVAVEVRADSGFAVPEVYAWCEQAGVAYTIGLVPNPQLEARAAPCWPRRRRSRPATGARVPGGAGARPSRRRAPGGDPPLHALAGATTLDGPGGSEAPQRRLQAPDGRGDAPRPGALGVVPGAGAG